MKATADQLLSEIAPQFTQFLMAGDLTSFTKKIDPNLNIDNIEKLLKIHFVLTHKDSNNEVGVIDFVENLSRRLRRIRTTVVQRPELFLGEIKGKIRWKETLSRRYSQNPDDDTVFICDRTLKEYDIPENLVLKNLLQIIRNIIYFDLDFAIKNEYKWLREWTKEKELREILNQLFYRNVYLKRITLSNVRISGRMLNIAVKSRVPLYREAAILLSRYRDLMDYKLDADEAKELLNNTFIMPDKLDVLFELYWAIKLIRQFDSKDVRFQLIKPGNNLIATWELHDDIYKLYHDSIGKFKFSENVEGLAEKLSEHDNYLGRELKVLGQLEDMAGKTESLWGGRPDILLEKCDKSGKLLSVFIGEIKYTDDNGYAVQGLRELLEYMALIKEKYKYTEDYIDLFDKLKVVRGCLFIDRVEGLTIKSTPNVQVVMFDEDKYIECE